MSLKVGTKVRVVKYGSLMWIHRKEYQKYIDNGWTVGKRKPYSESEDILTFDMMPQLIRKKGTIVKISDTGKYAVEGISEKYAWYDRKQLKRVWI